MTSFRGRDGHGYGDGGGGGDGDGEGDGGGDTMFIDQQISRRNTGHHPCVRGREYSRVSPRLRGM